MSKQPIRGQASKLTQLLTMTTTHKFPLQEVVKEEEEGETTVKVEPPSPAEEIVGPTPSQETGAPAAVEEICGPAPASLQETSAPAGQEPVKEIKEEDKSEPTIEEIKPPSKGKSE